MERTEIRESILDILQDINEDVDYESENKLMADEVLDSFDLITLASEIGEEFDKSGADKCLYHINLLYFCLYCLYCIIQYPKKCNGYCC